MFSHKLVILDSPEIPSIHINGRSGFSKQTNNNTLYHRCTYLGNFATPNYVMKYSNRDLLAKVTKNLAINIRFVVIKG